MGDSADTAVYMAQQKRLAAARRRRARAAREKAAKSKVVAERRASESRAVAKQSTRKETPEQKAKRLGLKTIKQLEKQGKTRKRAAIAGALPYVDEGDVKEVEDAVVGIPAGVYGIGKAVALDAVKPKGGPLDFRKSRTGKIAKEVGKATARDIRHPLRNPLMTALTASGVVSAGAGTAARGAAAASAAKTGGMKAAGKAALTRPSPGVRVHTYKDQQIRGRYSSAASSRGVQKAADKLRERKGAPLLHPKPKPGEKRSTITGRKAERLLSEERRVTDAAAKAPHLRLLADAPRSDKGIGRLVGRYRKFDGTAKDMAIRVAAEGVPLDDVIEAHIRAASQVEVRLKNRKRGGVPAGGTTTQQAFRLNGERKELLRKAALLEESRKYIDEVDGTPKVKPELERSYNLARESAMVREGRVKKAGLLSLQQAESRKHAPGRMNIKTVSGGRAIKQERPRTLPEAEAELAKMDTKVDRALKAMVDREYNERKTDYDLAADISGLKPRSGREVRPEDIVRRKHAGSAESIATYGKAGNLDIQRSAEKAVPVERRSSGYSKGKRTGRELAEEEVLRRMRASEHPLARKFVETIDEAADLRKRVEAHNVEGFMREDVLPELGSVTEFKRFEDVEPTSPGDFRVPDVMRSRRLPHGPTAYRGGVPRKPGTLTHSYTGALRRTGKYTPHTRRAIAEDALEAERYLSVERFRQRLLPMGTKVRPPDSRTTKYVPLKVEPLKRTDSEHLREMLKDVDPELLTPDEAVRVEQAVKAWEEQLFPAVERYASVRAGDAVKDVVWIDSKLLGSQRKLIGRLPVYDVTADAIKGLILYGKPGYVTPNLAGNAALNIFQQGVLAPANWARAVRLPREVGFLVDEVMGQGFSRALAEGTRSPISGAVQKAGNFWSYFVDTPFRRAAFIHEARRMGAKTPDDYRRLIMDSNRRSELGEVAQRARDAIIDYERLGPLERDIVRRALFVYPWVKGSTYYAVQFLRDHPILAATFAKIGEQGMEQSREELGALPSWARGSFRVGGSDERPLIVNPAAVSPFQTPAQLAATARGAITGHSERSEQIGEMANPVLQAGLEAGFGRELFTGRELGGSVPERFGGQILKGLPQYLLQKRIREADDPATADKAYPYSVGEAIGQFVVGSSFPRPANRDTLNEQAVTARTPAEKAKRAVDKERAEMVELYKTAYPEALKGDKLPPVIAKAFTRRQTVEQARTAVESEFDVGIERDRAKLVREVDIALKWNLVEAPVARKMKAFAKTANHDAIKDEREWITSHWFDDAYLGTLRDERKWLEERQ